MEKIINNEKLFISFSGGRTSGYMTNKIMESYAEKYKEVVVAFANTGQEHEKTLEFIDNCDKVFGFNTIWVEAAVNPVHGKGNTHKVVTFETASRNGEPFEAVIQKHGIPNQAFPQCTRELKLAPLRSLMREIGWKANTYDTAIGIRTDETRRVRKDAENVSIVYPLIDWFPTDKHDVLDWWSEQEFDLCIAEHHGNCTWCWKKSIKKHMLLMQEMPDIFDFPEKMEEKYNLIGPEFKKYSNSHPRTFFRGQKSVKDLKALFLEIGSSTIPIKNLSDENSGCSESCELYATGDA